MLAVRAQGGLQAALRRDGEVLLVIGDLDVVLVDALGVVRAHAQDERALLFADLVGDLPQELEVEVRPLLRAAGKEAEEFAGGLQVRLRVRGKVRLHAHGDARRGRDRLDLVGRDAGALALALAEGHGQDHFLLLALDGDGGKGRLPKVCAAGHRLALPVIPGHRGRGRRRGRGAPCRKQQQCRENDATSSFHASSQRARKCARRFPPQYTIKSPPRQSPQRGKRVLRRAGCTSWGTSARRGRSPRTSARPRGASP